MTLDDRMTGIDVQFVGLPSPTAPRVGAGGHPCQGLYYSPKGARPKTAVIATHYNVDFSEHYIAPFFAERGLGFLGWNTRYRGAEDQFLLEQALIDIGVGMRWLREDAGVERIVFGSKSPLFYFESNSLKLREAGIAGPVASAILEGNASALLQGR